MADQTIYEGLKPALEGAAPGARDRRMHVGPDGHSFMAEGTNGQGVLLLHGITGAPVEMKFVAKRLIRSGFSVMAPLLPGHGSDLATLRRSRWTDWFDGAAEAAGRFAANCDRIHVAGICAGGLLGLRLANETPAVRSVAVYSPLLFYNGWNAPFHYRYGHYAVPVAVRLGLSRFIAVKERHPFGIKSDRIRRLLTETPEGLRGTLPAFPVDTLHQTYALYRWTRAHLHRMTKPTLIIHSRVDDLAGPGNAVYMADRIAGPCRIEWLEDSYHMIHVDQEHAVVADHTSRFFEQADHCAEAGNAPAPFDRRDRADGVGDLLSRRG